MTKLELLHQTVVNNNIEKLITAVGSSSSSWHQVYQTKVSKFVVLLLVKWFNHIWGCAGPFWLHFKFSRVKPHGEQSSNGQTYLKIKDIFANQNRADIFANRRQRGVSGHNPQGSNSPCSSIHKRTKNYPFKINDKQQMQGNI